jgi:hypothetical protein
MTIAGAQPPMFAHLGTRELPVRWAWFRPEPRVGDIVRLPTTRSGRDGWQSYRVVGKRPPMDSASDGVPSGTDARMMGAIHLDVEPLAADE